MSLVESYHDEHKARLFRLGALPKPSPVPTFYVAPIPGIDPEPYYAGMWFHELVTMRPVDVVKNQKIGRIQSVVARQFHISTAELLSDRRDADVMLPRQIGYYLSKKLTSKCTREIGRRFNRDHSSIVHGSRRIERLLRSDISVAERVRHICAELQS